MAIWVLLQILLGNEKGVDKREYFGVEALLVAGF